MIGMYVTIELNTPSYEITLPTYTEVRETFSEVLSDNLHRRAAPSDFAIANRAACYSDYTNIEGYNTGYWWTQTWLYDDGSLLSRHVSTNGAFGVGVTETSYTAIRIMLKLSDADSIISEAEYNSDWGCYIVELGEYPQTYVGDTLNATLEEWYVDQTSTRTYTLTTDYETTGELSTTVFKAYEYTDGEVYVRVPLAYSYGSSLFRDGTSFSAASSYWFKVEPIEWLILNYSTVDEDGVVYILSKDSLVGGVPFDINDGSLSDFTETSIYGFITQYFAVDVLSDVKLDYKIDHTQLTSVSGQLVSAKSVDEPSVGIKAGSGTLKFKDVDKVFVEYSRAGILTSNNTINVYMQDSNSGKEQLVGVWKSKDWSFDTDNETMTVTLQDDIEKLQDIEMNQTSLYSGMTDFSTSKTLKEILDWVQTVTPSSFVFAELGSTEKSILNSISIPVPYMESGTLWTFYDNICQAAQLCMFKNGSGEIVIEKLN